MDYTIAFGSGPADVTVVLRGAAQREPFLQMIDAVVEDPRFRHGMDVLFDDSELDASPLSAEDIRAIADRVVERGKSFGAGRMAIVAPRSLTFGLARMFEARAEEASVDIRIFDRREEAEDWLRDT